jgi:hypothetical protein
MHLWIPIQIPPKVSIGIYFSLSKYIYLKYLNFSIYSNQGHNHSGSYRYTIKTKDGDNYSFISVDMCPRPGIGGPFNFYGHLNNVKKENFLK